MSIAALIHRSMMGGEALPNIPMAFVAKNNPFVCQAFFDAGLASSNQYMTQAEAAAVTEADMSNLVGYEKVFDTVFREPFDGYQYFTGISNVNLTNVRGTSIVLPPQCTTLSMRYFGYRTGITDLVVRIPASVTRIMYRGLADLPTNTVVIFEGTTPPNFNYETGTLENAVGSAATYTFYAPDESLSLYQAKAANYTILPISQYQ